MAEVLDQRLFYVPILRPRIVGDRRDFKRSIAIKIVDKIVDVASIGVDHEMERLSRLKWYELERAAPDYLRYFGDERAFFEAYHKYPWYSGVEYYMWWGVTDEKSPNGPWTKTRIKLGVTVTMTRNFDPPDDYASESMMRDVREKLQGWEDAIEEAFPDTTKEERDEPGWLLCQVDALRTQRDASIECLRRAINGVKIDTFFVDYSEDDPIGQMVKELYDGIEALVTMPMKEKLQQLHELDLERVRAKDRAEKLAEEVERLQAEVKLLRSSGNETP